MADLIHLDQEMYGMQNDPINMALRRYAGMAVTNLTFGDVVNKVGKPSLHVLAFLAHSPVASRSIQSHFVCWPQHVVMVTDNLLTVCLTFRRPCAQRRAAFRLWWPS